MDIFCLGATLAELLLDEPIQKRHHAQHFGSPDYLHYLAEPVDLKVGIIWRWSVDLKVGTALSRSGNSTI